MVDSFRCPARHFFHAALFLALLAGLGVDTLHSASRAAKWQAIGCATVAAFLLTVAAYLHYGGGEAEVIWKDILDQLATNGETRRSPDVFKIKNVTAHAANAIAIAGSTSGLLAVLYALARKRSGFTYAIVSLGVIEMLTFAFTYRLQTDLSKRMKPELFTALQPMQKDARIFDMAMSNYPLLTGLNDMWGYDSTALMRYAQLVAYTQDTRVEYEMTEFAFKWFHPGYAMFRCEYIVDSRGAGSIVRRFDNPAPRAMLVSDYAVITNPEDRYALLADPAFDLRSRVLLESEPSPKPEKGSSSGKVTITDESTDAFNVEVDTPNPAILLITDSYAADWSVYPIGTGSQTDYTILPANHCLRAIPLGAGKHQLRLAYSPPAAAWGSGAGVLGCSFFIIAAIARMVRRGQMTPITKAV